MNGTLNYGVQRGTRRLPSPIFVGLVVLLVVSGWATWSRIGSVRVDAFVFIASAWLVSLCLHEFGHAITAYRFGDHSVAERGYLTLNPMRYTNLLLSLVLPLIFVLLGGFGMPGGAVWIERGRIQGRVRHSLVSAAGPLTNVIFTIALAAPFWTTLSYAHVEFWSAVAFLCFLQATASILNLVPMPGLDGFGIVEPWLPAEWRRGARYVAPYGMLLVFALLWQSRVNALFFGAVYWITSRLGVSPDVITFGGSLLRFWD